MVIPGDYECNNNGDNDKDEKVEGGDIFVNEGGKPNTRGNNRRYGGLL